MLAEPKSRTVWTLNPRGKFWSEDKNKLGQKLLESMGWKEGKGLGKHENGMKEHIKVCHKSDNKGLGFKPTADYQWIDNNNSYEEILAQLAIYHNNGSNVETKVSNLEEKSKKIRNRVHYHKFIKAKNLSQCTQKDLSSIFPKRIENSDTENKCLNELNVETHPIEVKNSDVKNTFESTTNMNDYFKSKMDKLKIKSEFFSKNDYTKSEEILGSEDISEEITVFSDNESDESKGKKRNKHNKVDNSKANSEETNEDIEKSDSDLIASKSESKKSKRKKENLNSTNEKEWHSGIDNNLSDVCIAKVSKSKKSKKQNKINDESESIKVEEAESGKSIEKSNKSRTKLNKKCKNKIRVPTGYDKIAFSVNDSLKNYHRICEAIAKDKTLNTTNLISLHGYGYETD